VLDNYGMDYQFSAPRNLCIVLPADTISTEAARVEYTLQAFASSRVDSSVYLRRTEENLPVLRGVQLTPGTTRDTARYHIERGGRGTSSLVLLPLPTLTMPLRGYVLTADITVGDRSWVLRRPFRALWPDMPFSLREVDRALDVLRYVASETTLDSLRDGDFEQRRDNLENFWKPRDQTPETAMNEVMAEYYRRADHAMMAFSTLAQPDGARTDRGRIYILHGPPSRTDRTLHPREGYVEVWDYDHLRKRFTFVDPLKKGEYVLSSTSSL
jgi:GWxTD domain-containing protein